MFYRLSEYGGSANGWFLSSDVNHANNSQFPSGTTNHADWWGAWHKETMNMWVANCNNVAGADCEAGILRQSPLLSLVERKTGYYRAQRIPAADLVKLCPSKQWNGTARDVATCKHQ